MTEYSYVGQELGLFAQAVEWKRYYGSLIARHVRGDVLEVGAGIGGTTRWLCDGRQDSWTCLEPDRAQAAELRSALLAPPLPIPVRVESGFVADLPAAAAYDTILYIDVLEHITDDRAELRDAAARLRPEGRLVVLAPAHQWLFSRFDRAVGHQRRYTRASLEAIGPEGTRIVESYFLDALGILVSLGHRLRRRALPTRHEVDVWQRYVVPASRRVDGWVGRRIGKTVVVVFEKVPA